MPTKYSGSGTHPKREDEILEEAIKRLAWSQHPAINRKTMTEEEAEKNNNV